MNLLGTKQLETDRLILRRFTPNDIEKVYQGYATDLLTSRYLSWDPHKNIEVTKKFIENIISKYDQLDYFHWVVELKDTNEVIGGLSVVNFSEKNSTAEIGYCYESKYWGNGYASEALRKVIEFLLLEVGVRLVEARHISGNPASGKVMQKAGMIKDAILRDRKINKDTKEVNDLIVYSIKNDEL